ncbi:MAG: AMP-binding protein [Acidimicrobiia bacterium]|nr:MAG: AMP-binding protein [Acidimicrobiia bacterium]
MAEETACRGTASAPAPTLPLLLAHNTATRGEADAVVTPDAAISHGGLDRESRAVAARLVAAGVGKGTRLGLLAPNGIEWVVVAAAAWRVGAVLVPLSTLARPPELAALLRAAAVTHLVYAPSFRGRHYPDDVAAAAREAPALRRAWTIDGLPGVAVDDALVDALGDVVRPADDLAVVFTSGSRGTPKGTIHTHGSALRAVAAGLADRGIGPDDRLYLPMPLFWTGGLAAGLLSALVAGAALCTEADPEPGRTIGFLERARVTLFRGWPDQAERIAAHPRFASADLSSLRPGSLPGVLPPSARPAPGTRPNLFGMTETFGPYCGAPLDRDLPDAARGSCGRPFAGVEVRIVDGEIRVRGPNLMRAICGRTRDETFDADGFYPTGDLGRLDPTGHLWFLGRADDMFKVRGATVYPSEVEAALRAVDGVREAHVTDVPAAGGEREVGALVVTDRPLRDVATGVRTRLSAFKVPTRWVVTASADDVPLTPTAKVDTAALRDLLRAKGTTP